jgi:hypothetical protein
MVGSSTIARSRWPAVFLVVVLCLLCLPITASAAESTGVSISAPKEPLQAGDQFSVNIEAVPGSAIAGMQSDLSFDASLVAVTAVQEGDLLNQTGATTFFNQGTVDNQAGKVTGVFGAITTRGMTVSTPGIFATVTFTAKQQGQGCPLNLSNVVVGDINGNAVSVSLENEGSPGAPGETPVFRWWVLSVIVGVAVVLIALTVAGILLRRRQIVRALEVSGSRHQKDGAGVE